MALNFAPPPEWLLQQYLQRKQPAEIANEAVQTGIQGYAAIKQQQAAKQQAALDTYVNAFKTGGPQFAADIAKRTGLQNPPMLPGNQPPTASTGTVTAGVMPPGAPVPAVSPLIHASVAAGHGNPLGYQLPSPEEMAAFSQQGDYGKGKIEEASKTLAMQKSFQDVGPKKVMTKEQALAAGTVDPSTMIVEPPDTSARDQKYGNEQDKLEQQAIDRLSKLRGDQSLARTENQRDAAIQAYNTIERVKQEGRMPSQLEYYDILGQMWKARTGASPTDQALKDLDAKTLKGDLGKAYQYFAGKPAGKTTPEILQNIQDFAADSGLQSDKFHDSYMASHKIKPSGLEDKRWQPLFNSHRGMSFVEGTGYQPKAAASTATAYSDPGKEARYQAWKASQAKP